MGASRASAVRTAASGHRADRGRAAHLAVVRDALLRLDEASAALRMPQRERLRISAAPALGSKWLVSRVAEYQDAHPNLEFSLGTATGLGPLLNGEANIGLRYGEEEWPQEESEESLTPISRPKSSTMAFSTSPGWNNAVRSTAILAFFLLTLGGCQTAYEAGQQNAEHQCRKLPPGEVENCLARINRQSYSDYEKERRAR
ncbi:MAG: LysR substrate-binding domain-containing protein [Azonexus sp.]|nr:LysR substrate-binding domain-containing protein [Azonexus sp.]